MTDIRLTRQRFGLSQKELGDHLGLHQTTISRMETGDIPVDERTALAIEGLEARLLREQAALDAQPKAAA